MFHGRRGAANFVLTPFEANQCNDEKFFLIVLVLQIFGQTLEILFKLSSDLGGTIIVASFSVEVLIYFNGLEVI